MNALQLGPLAVSVDAGGWQHYESGVYDAPFKSHSTTIDIDHGRLASGALHTVATHFSPTSLSVALMDFLPIAQWSSS